MLLDDICDYLTTGSIGVTTGTNLFKASAPDTPDKVAVVYETGGYFPIHAMAQATAVVERPSIQVMVRAAGYQGARMLAHNIYRRLDSVRGATINGTVYHWISAIQSPADLQEDGSGRHQVVCNYQIIKAVSTATST